MDYDAPYRYATRRPPPVTLREAISRKKRPLMILWYGGFFWFVAAMLLPVGAWRLLLAVPGLMLSAACAGYALFRLRCPRCHGRIGHTVVGGSPAFTVSPDIRFCPFCGVALDTELGAQQ